MPQTINLDIPNSAAEREAIRTAFCCSGCGKPAPDQVKPCQCATGVGFRIIDGKIQHCSFIETDGSPERAQAIALAHRVLDKPYIDPDGDICLLARQFLREIERAPA